MMTSRLTRNIRLGIKSLLLHKMRSLLTMLGVVFGVASVIAMLAVGEGASEEAQKQIKKLGSNNILLSSIKAIEDESSGTVRKRMSLYGLRYEDEQRITQSFSTIEKTVPAKILRKQGRLHERSLELRVVGTTPGWFELVQSSCIAGRVLIPTDLENTANVVVLTESGSRKLLATEHAIGESIRIGGNYFEVIGIVQNEQSTGNTQIPDSDIDAYIPLSTASERYGDISIIRSAGSSVREYVELHKLLVKVRDINQVEPTARGIEQMLRHFHEQQDYKMYVPLALLRQAEAQARIWKWTLFSIAAISLLVGGIGIMNIMLASVTERTREIGIRRAIGATKRQIVGQFLIETVVLSAVGGLVGIIVGPTIARFITYFSEMKTIVPLDSILLSIGISMTVGIVFGLYPAIRAANLDPIVALRHE